MGVWSAIKSALRFPAYGGSGIQRGGIGDWMTFYAGRGYDYQEAAGPLHRNGVVMACAAWIMRAFPEPPLQVVKEDETGEPNKVPHHALTKAFRRPNPFYGADCLWQRVAFDRSIHGQAFLYKMRNDRGDVASLWHVPQHRLIPQWDPSGKVFIDHYLFMVDARQEQIPIEDIVHFRFGGDPDRERNGLASLGAGLREIGALNEGADYRGAILHNVGVPSHLIQNKDPTKPINAEQATRLHALWAERVSGNNRGKPIIPNWALEAIKLGYSPEELDIGNMLDPDSDLVCALFGLSSMVVGLSSGTAHRTYANYKEARQSATETALIPAWKQIGQELTAQLLPDYSDDETEHVVFDTTNVRVLQEDHSAIWKRIDDAVRTGWLTINEARAIVNLPPVTGGDVFLPARGEQPVYLGPDSAGDRPVVGREADLLAASTNGNGT